MTPTQHRSRFNDTPVEGERITGVSAGPGYTARWSGVYLGVRPSEWDGQPVHFFADGEINGVPQSCHAIPVAQFDTPPAPASEIPGGPADLDERERGYRVRREIPEGSRVEIRDGRETCTDGTVVTYSNAGFRGIVAYLRMDDGTIVPEVSAGLLFVADEV